MAGRPDAVSATSRAAVTPFEPSTEWPGGAAIDARGGTAITAEIPAVPVAPAYGVLLPDGSIWYPGSKRKLPAPPFLRVTVWTLAFLVAVVGAGLVVEHYHPSWMDPVRHIVGTPGQPAGTGGTGTTRPAAGSNEMKKTSQTANSVTYSVPGVPYVLEIKTTRRCYVVVKSLTDQLDLFASTISADVTQSVFVPSGSTALEAYAGGASLSVSFHGKQVGTIDVLRYAVSYNFNPSSS
ncbi:MAG: hypothetical protein WAV54_10655 [Acidimicrobiales bacterium]